MPPSGFNSSVPSRARASPGVVQRGAGSSPCHPAAPPWWIQASDPAPGPGSRRLSKRRRGRGNGLSAGFTAKPPPPASSRWSVAAAPGRKPRNALLGRKVAVTTAWYRQNPLETLLAVRAAGQRALGSGGGSFHLGNPAEGHKRRPPQPGVLPRAASPRVLAGIAGRSGREEEADVRTLWPEQEAQELNAPSQPLPVAPAPRRAGQRDRAQAALPQAPATNGCQRCSPAREPEHPSAGSEGQQHFPQRRALWPAWRGPLQRRDAAFRPRTAARVVTGNERAGGACNPKAGVRDQQQSLLDFPLEQEPV